LRVAEKSSEEAIDTKGECYVHLEGIACELTSGAKTKHVSERQTVENSIGESSDAEKVCDWLGLSCDKPSKEGHLQKW
jgi:hypothetical protein